MPYACTAGSWCLYQNDTGYNFTILCQCDMKGALSGFCPIPDQSFMTEYIIANVKVWNNDNCHTLDRDNFYAQIDCGIGDNDDTLKTANDYKFNLTYWALIQDPERY